MNILFLSNLAEYLIPEIQSRLTSDQNNQIDFYYELISPEDADLIFMDYSLSEFKDLFNDLLKFRTKVAILIGEDNYGDINKILYETGVNHLFTVSENLEQLNFVSDVTDFIQNWTKERDTSIIIPNPNHVTTTRVISSKNIDQAIQDLLKGHDFSNCFEDLTSCLTNILDEALSNALFRAPVDHSGNYLYRNYSRSETVNAIPGKEVEAKLFTDDKNTVISIKDFYGSLTENNIFDYPPGTGEFRQDGMRLGMYLIFRYGNKYLINVSRGKYTENIIVIENSKRFKNYDVREKSFHFFIREDNSL